MKLESTSNFTKTCEKHGKFWGYVPLQFTGESGKRAVNWTVLRKASVYLPLSYTSFLLPFQVFFHTIRHVCNVNLHKTGHFSSKWNFYSNINKTQQMPAVLAGNRISCYTSCNKGSKCAVRLEWLPDVIMNIIKR